MNVANDALTRTSLSRLRWQCRRGMLELDLMLQPFCDNDYLLLSKAEQKAFQLLLTTPDQDLLEYLMEQKTPDNKDVADVVIKIRKAAAS